MCDSYMRIICVYHVCDCRYVWGYRNTLARSVHDMCQQMFSPTYTKVAFKAICKWLYEPEDDNDHQDRRERLVKFKRDDDEVFELAAQCFWSMATGVNQPWGRSYTHPTYYLHLDCREKVRNGHIISWVRFFFSVCFVVTHMSVRHGVPHAHYTHVVCSHVSGMVLCGGDSPVVGESPNHAPKQLRLRGLASSQGNLSSCRQVSNDHMRV